ncbi:MAG: HdaA/DnaA family protein [Hasllibacter sp.]
MSAQLPLPLPAREALGREDYLVTDATAPVLAALDGWPRWPGGKALLTGPAGAGKSHLARVWAAGAGARVVVAATVTVAAAPDLAARPLAVEDVDRAAGRDAAGPALFHLHNLMAETGTPLLMTARGGPGEWRGALPDLASRAAQALRVPLPPPDDRLLAALAAKQFADRGLAPDPKVIAWLTTHTERSPAAIRAAVARLDAAALAGKRPVTVPLARATLS